MRQLTPGSPLPSLRISSHARAPPLNLDVNGQAFLLLGSSAFICQWILRDTRWQSAEALKHFCSKCPQSPLPLFFFYFAIILFFLFESVLLFCSSGPSTDTCMHTHILYIHFTLSHIHTQSLLGSCAKVCICVEPLAPESRSRSLKKKTSFFFLLVSLNAFLHCAYIDGMDGKSNTCA